MSTIPELERWQSVLDRAFPVPDISLLTDTIDGALAVAPPAGSPAIIRELGNAYQQASSTCETLSGDLSSVATSKLPTAWKGDVAETASQAITALSNEAWNAQNALGFAGDALQTWADTLQKAQQQDRSGRDQLQSARSGLHPATGEFRFPAIMAEVNAGITTMIAAVRLTQTAGETTAALLTQLAGQATAERLDASGLGALDAVVLANEQNAQSDGGGDILTAEEMARATKLMGAMSAAQLQQFERLLAGAKSPEEAAYLMKALAAGHSLSEVEQFDALIHPYGNNPGWLSQHLTPDMTSGTYGKAFLMKWPKLKPGHNYYSIYNQGNIGDCVAASTVVAMANLDPAFMLKLTTGNHPGVPGSDSPTAFQHRLQGAFISQYQQGQRAERNPHIYPAFDGGLGTTGGNLLANSDLGKATGTTYQYVPLHGGSDNAAILPQIIKATGSGQPVPMGVTNGSSYHQVVIIGTDSATNDLEVFNPNAGSVSLVSLQQFITNSASGSWNLPTISGVELPSP